MTRVKRATKTGMPYHVTQIGNCRRKVLEKKKDFQKYGLNYKISIILIISSMFMFSCTSGKYVREGNVGYSSFSAKAFKRTALDTVKKYRRGECNLFVRDVLNQHGVKVEGNADGTIDYIEKSPEWTKIDEDEVSRRVRQGKIIVVCQHKPPGYSAGHVAFVVDDDIGKKKNMTAVLGTFRREIVTINYEFDLKTKETAPIMFFMVK